MKFDKCPKVTYGGVTRVYVESAANGDKWVLIDTEDIPKLLGWNITIQRSKRDSTDYVRLNKFIDGINCQPLLHRFLLDAPPELKVDHINFQGTDCRKANLRLCNNHQSGENRQGATAYNTHSKVRGVHWHKSSKKWRARVQCNGIPYYLGALSTIEEADKVVTAWRQEFMTFSSKDQEARRLNG